ncbi:Retrovirus-related Pol polyprotein from transposon 17.6 [Pyrus ussuriensis x Pyrus communis]|uniref:Retrovirus-related Pol polyprotein from transposon 17.6 n=1 Tax=Pyrus ussuriensis x Pyrus communis TaxID=2448454 RepID=A0A5N5FCB2_9ROSA|nr:Retrovirus-related Pol polyprotein from transposon 17.6 [Pyrus ussuriensis x Pyrus communis]
MEADTSKLYFSPRQGHTTAHVLQENPKFKSLFNQLEYDPKARITTVEALMHVSEDYGPQCYNAQLQKAFLENNNAIIFIDEDMEMAFLEHRRPLYLEGQIDDIFIRLVLTTTGVPMTKVVRSQISINGFGNISEETMGYIEIDLRIGLVREYGGIEHQANEVPKEAEDMPAPIGEDESLQKIMPAPKSEMLDREAVIHSTFHPRISSSNKSLRPTAQEREGIRIYQRIIAVIRREAPSIDAPFPKEAPEDDGWREIIRRKLFKPSRKLSIKCLKE